MAKAPSLIERLGRVWQLSDHVVACRFERSGALAFALGDGSLTIIPHADGEPLTVQAHAGGCLSLAAAPGGGFISGGDDGRFLAISVAGEVTELANYPGRWLDNVSSHPAGVIACSEGKRLHLTRIGKPTISFEYPSTVGGFCFSPDGKRVAVAHYGGVSIRAVNDQHSGVLALKWAGSHLDVTWSPDSRFILSAMQENCIRGWRLKDKQDFHMSGYASKVKSWAWVLVGVIWQPVAPMLSRAGRLAVAKAPWAKRLSPWVMPNPDGSRPLLRHPTIHWWLQVTMTGSC